jgi:hypothetical protein
LRVEATQRSGQAHNSAPLFRLLQRFYNRQKKRQAIFNDPLRRSLCGCQHDVMYRAYQQARTREIENIWRKRAPGTFSAGLNPRQARGIGQHQHAQSSKS